MRQEKSILLDAIRMTTIALISLCMVSAAAAAPAGKNKRSPKYSSTAKPGIHRARGNRRLPRHRYVNRASRSNTLAATRHVRRDNDRLRRLRRRPGHSYTYRPDRRPRFLVADNDRPYHAHDRDHYRYRDHDRDHHRYRYREHDRERFRYRGRFHGYIPLSFDGLRYFYHDGAYYRYTGLGFSLVDDDDIGVYLYSLPFGYRTLFIGGYPYYYVHHHYFIHDRMRNVYVQVDDPNQTVADKAGGDSSAYHKLVVYPKKGQSAEQEKQDKYECYLWAVKQTGFDPGMGQPGNLQDYQRAKSACLEGRGYVVN